MVLLSYTMIVVYSRDHKGVGVAHEIKSSKKQLQFSLAVLVGPKQAFRLTRNAFNKLLRNYKNMGLIFSLFDIASAQQVPFGIPQCVQCILHGLTSPPLCPIHLC